MVTRMLEPFNLGLRHFTSPVVIPKLRLHQESWVGNEKAIAKGWKAAAHTKRILPNCETAIALASGRGMECGSVRECLSSLWDVRRRG